MITYKDKLFCIQECANQSCWRNYTPQERAVNEANFGLPVAYADFKTEDCGYKPVGKQ